MSIRMLRWALAVLVGAAFPVGAKDCDTCQDLCRLMDQYLQREKGIELWRRYAPSTPRPQRQPIPDGITDSAGIESHVFAEFSDWLKSRELPCVPKGQPKRGAAVDLETDTQGEDCEILFQGRKLEGDALRDYESAVDCKILSDAVIAHEAVHQLHCRQAWYESREHARDWLDDPRIVAESELQAWTRHQEVLEEGIRRIVHTKGCGWEPTVRQRADMHAVPSLKQTQEMQQRGWKAAAALSGGKVTN